jgi:CubicO group peptidase (beta-lactamase class C family)
VEIADPADTFRAAGDLLDRAAAGRVAPALVVEVGDARRVVWRRATGRLTYAASAPPATEATIFDLASLTKALAAAPIAMRLLDAGRLRLDDPIARWIPGWRGADRQAATIRHLLAHSSGLPAHAPLYMHHAGRAAYEAAICDVPLAFSPGAGSTYSDLGFMLLGFILEDAGGARFDAQFAALAHVFGVSAGDLPTPTSLGFRPPATWRPLIAPTEVHYGHAVTGEVHDENARALGGVAAHAGLFGAAEAVGRCARWMLGLVNGSRDDRLVSRETARRFVQPAGPPPSSRALAWDTMRPTSSCGAHMSASAFGHTAFTGCSLWIDPEHDVYVVVLSNRVHPSRSNERHLKLRPALHDAIMTALS